MADSATLATPAVPTGSDSVVWPLGAIWRDIARGGIAGLAVGIVVAGLGGRLAMRMIALLIPESSGSFTENGNRIGDITLEGTVALVIFGGLFAGIFLGVLWVVVSPWLPRSVGLRALAAVPLAIGLGAFGLIQGNNPDFAVLGYDPSVLAVLLGLIGLVGVSMAVMDAWLDGRLPQARSSKSQATGIYAAIALVGGLFAIGVVATFLDRSLRPAGIALVVTGLATLAWWYLRLHGAERPPLRLRLLGSGSVIAAVAFGLFIELPQVRVALGDF